jgi:site-specific DNA-cytosine methylase
LWRTPKADDPFHGPASETGIQKRLAEKQTIRLQDQVNHSSLFRTPDAGCSRGAQSKKRFAASMKAGRLLTLNDQIAHLPPERKIFPTPKASDGTKEQRTAEGAAKEANRGHGISLPAHVRLYPTPTISGDYNKKGLSANSGDGLATFVRKLYPTPIVNDSKNNAPLSQHTENGRHSNPLNVVAGGALNPCWVEWLMGFPAGWTDVMNEPRRSAELFRAADMKDWWETEPEIPRTASGIPSRVQRLKALGNAVVPAQIYPLFKGIAEIWRADNQRRRPG